MQLLSSTIIICLGLCVIIAGTALLMYNMAIDCQTVLTWSEEGVVSYAVKREAHSKTMALVTQSSIACCI